MEPMDVNRKVLRGPAWQIQKESTTHCVSSLTALPGLGHSCEGTGLHRGGNAEWSEILRLWGWTGDMGEAQGLERWDISLIILRDPKNA